MALWPPVCGPRCCSQRCPRAGRNARCRRRRGRHCSGDGRQAFARRDKPVDGELHSAGRLSRGDEHQTGLGHRAKVAVGRLGHHGNTPISVPFWRELIIYGVKQARFWPVAPHSQRPDFCSWQAGRKRINSRLRTCWLSLARPCSHSKMLKRQEKVPFRTTVRLARKEENPSSRWNRAGAVGLTGDLDPVRDCRRPRRTQVFQRLNRMACIDG